MLALPNLHFAYSLYPLILFGIQAPIAAIPLWTEIVQALCDMALVIITLVTAIYAYVQYRLFKRQVGQAQTQIDQQRLEFEHALQRELIERRHRTMQECSAQIISSARCYNDYRYAIRDLEQLIKEAQNSAFVDESEVRELLGCDRRGGRLPLALYEHCNALRTLATRIQSKSDKPREFGEHVEKVIQAADRAATDLLNVWDQMAVGIDLGIYDEEVIYRDAGSAIQFHYREFASYIRHVRRGDARLLQSLEDLVTRVMELDSTCYGMSKAVVKTLVSDLVPQDLGKQLEKLQGNFKLGLATFERWLDDHLDLPGWQVRPFKPQIIQRSHIKPVPIYEFSQISKSSDNALIVDALLRVLEDTGIKTGGRYPCRWTDKGPEKLGKRDFNPTLVDNETGSHTRRFYAWLDPTNGKRTQFVGHLAVEYLADSNRWESEFQQLRELWPRSSTNPSALDRGNFAVIKDLYYASEEADWKKGHGNLIARLLRRALAAIEDAPGEVSILAAMMPCENESEQYKLDGILASEGGKWKCRIRTGLGVDLDIYHFDTDFDRPKYATYLPSRSASTWHGQIEKPT